MSTWIFLRGLVREARHWGDFPNQFLEANPETSILTPDLPGNGQLNCEPSPNNIGEMVEFTRAELLRNGPPPPYHLLGLSLGAMVAVEWATRHPNELAAGVLINTSLRPFSPFRDRLSPGNYARLIELALLRKNATEIESEILRMTSARFDERADVIDSWVAYRNENPVKKMNALGQVIAAARYRAPMKKPEVPLLILAGAKDRLVNPRCSAQIAAKWQVQVHIHPDAGHDLPLDDGDWVASQVRDWLTSLH